MIVLDTCTILWDALDPYKLSPKAKAAIEKNHKNETLIFCEISLWEIAMLLSLKRVKVDCSYPEFIKLILAAKKYHLQGITPEIADLSVNHLKTLPKDPADRLIAATALHLNASLVTADKDLRKSTQIKTIW